jgi:hypothetical protein
MQTITLWTKLHTYRVNYITQTCKPNTVIIQTGKSLGVILSVVDEQTANFAALILLSHQNKSTLSNLLS